MESYKQITAAYYEKWLGQDGILSHDWKGTEYVYSQQRNIVQYGYSSQFDIYVLCQKERIVISYGDGAESWIDAVKAAVRPGMSAAEIANVLEHIFDRKTDWSVKYVFNHMPVTSPEARVLEAEDYSEYEFFWRKCHPGCSDTGWLREYFDEMVQNRMCIGVCADAMLASCTDAPGMPFMEEQAQEIGINTLPEYRKRGYAALACDRCVQELLAQHKAPLWSTAADNAPSRRLAEKAGFVEFADVVAVTL